MTAICLPLCSIILFSACQRQADKPSNAVPIAAANQPAQNEGQANTNGNFNAPNANFEKPPQPPNLQAAILDDRYKTTDSPVGNFDFKNYEYPLPHGWEDADGKNAILENGLRRMSETEKKIGLSYVATKFFDVTGDGQDEAFVILKIDTAGSAIPQIVYIFTWKNDKPELIWYFRTGDRSDGGLKDVRVENGELVVELFGQDRFLLGELETSKITDDLEQICCPTFFTRTNYKWNGNVFRMQGKRLTFSIADKNAAPVENMGEVVERESKKAKK